MAAEQPTTPEPHIPRLTFERRLMLSRDDLGLNQREFAERIGVSKRSVVNYENGKTRPNRPVLLSWALATGVPLEWLLTGEISGSDQDFAMSRCTRARQATLFDVEPAPGRAGEDYAEHATAA